MPLQSIPKRIVAFVLVISMLLTLVACSGSPPNPSLSDPNGQIHVENTDPENIITETVLTEFITQEIYLEELVIAENKIAELLLEENTINEVILCKTIYVPQDNIEEFAANSQTAQLFGEDFDVTSLLKKIAVGTGVIVREVVKPCRKEALFKRAGSSLRVLLEQMPPPDWVALMFRRLSRQSTS